MAGIAGHTIDGVQFEYWPPKGTLFDVDKIVKMKSGLWEIKTTSGFYMTSNKDYVTKTK